MRNPGCQWLLFLMYKNCYSYKIGTYQNFSTVLTICYVFLAHLTQRVMWAIAITWRPSFVVCRKLFQKSSPLKVQDQWKPNLVWIITRVSSFKIVSGDAVHQPTWPLLLKIEHMVKLQVLGNNSKTVNNIKNLTWGKNDQHVKIYLSCNFEVNLIAHLGVIALFSSNL